MGAEPILRSLDVGTSTASESDAGESQSPSTSAGGGNALVPPAPPAPENRKALSLGGYAEVFYQWNFGTPSNGITNFRGFDNRHNTFALSNVAVDAQIDYKGVVGRAALQAGGTPNAYYLAEPSRAGSPSVGATGPEVWKYIQQAYVGYRFPLGRGLLVLAGICLSPIGPEGIAVRDNWNWSRSNLFFGLPFYHTGIRATYPFSDRWSVTLAGFNGWNSVVDNNEEKSVSLQAVYAYPEKLTLSLLYFGGVEREPGAPEGRAWRHLFDVYATWLATRRLSLLAHLDAGFEPNTFGTSAWVAGAVTARVRIVSQLFLAARGDVFYEHAASSSTGAATRIFWPAPWVSSATVTIDYRPQEYVSFRLEYRHDHADADLYFAGAVSGDGATTPFVPNQQYQDTITLEATAWF